MSSERSEPYALAVSTQKGGAGKTTVATNLAGALAERQHRVLLIDTDPQGHATEGVGIKEAYDDDEPTLRSVLLDSNGETSIKEVIQPDGTGKFDVVPANADMAAQPQLESSLANSPAGERRLDLALRDVTDYDFIVIDCPPSLGALTDNALYASKRVLIPAKATGTSRRALELLLDKIQSLEYLHDLEIQPVGVVANEVRSSGVSDDTVEWFRSTFNGTIPVWELRKRVALERAWINGCSIFEHDEECDHAEDIFLQIAEHIEQRRSAEREVAQ